MISRESRWGGRKDRRRNGYSDLFFLTFSCLLLCGTGDGVCFGIVGVDDVVEDFIVFVAEGMPDPDGVHGEACPPVYV